MATTAFFLLIIAVIASSNLIHSYALNTILTNKSIRDGETLISAGGDFELGFFSPADSSSRYVGIWYKKLAVHTVIWVANREAPLHDSLGTLNLTHHGLLVLYNSTNHIVWSSNTSATAQDPTAELLNSGNLVVRNRRDESSKSLWQSFDYPCNSWIVGMRLGIDLETGFQRYLSSWKSNENPAKGEYSFAVYQTPQGYPQLVVKRGSTIIFRFGSWNGVELTGVARPNRNFLVPIEYIFNEKEITFHFIPIVNSSILLRYEINPFGLVHRLIWDDRIQDWYTSNFVQGDQCAVYAFCGAFGICNVESSPVCKCFDGFIANSTTNQSIVGCVRRMPLNCSDTDGFIKHAKVKLPDTSSSWYDQRIGLDECQRLCLRNCSCTAYANLDIRGTGCLMWFDDLIDVTVLNMEGQDLYVRVAASELGNRGSPNKKKLALIFTSLFLTVAMLITLLIIYTRYQRKRGNLKEDIIENDNDKERKEDIDSPLFNLTVIVEATNNFSSNNKLGEGGFGPVYKGVLVDGQEIAVKRLSKSSGQGLSEFKNEVILIAKLQHRNLVKLLGCCIHGDEKILIYEYMPNKSLDSFIFDQHRRKLLNWSMRFCIINGIARGILYLHQDSRLRVIHRDLKASNILLDKEMNPKISDFGLARTFGGDQSHANTSRIVGTYGYMSPEYAIDGLFSIKSDVFSFGVIVLEIINGQKNRGFSHPDHGLNLLGHAWMLCTKGKAINLLDECLKESSIVSEVIRCIHIALLCVQQRPEDRPTMSSVVMMLSRDFQLAEPKHPGYFLERDPPSVDTLSNINSTHSVDTVSITSLQAR